MRWLGTILITLLATGCGRTALVHYSFDASFDAGGSEGGNPDGGEEPPDAGCNATDVENYVIPPMDRRPIDVLFVIDDSCSMANDQRLLATNMHSFFTTFLAGQVDFHVGVVTTDMESMNRSGRLVAPFLTQNTPEVTARFQDMVTVGIDGSPDERGLIAAYTALRPPLNMTVNAGFVRPEADFALVFLTDEDDGSPHSVPFLANYVKHLKPEGAAITVGAILLACNGSDRWRYAEFTRQFGDRGIITRCTQNYATTLRTIAGRVVNKQCIVGLREPLDGSKQFTVTLDGAPTAWTQNPPEDAYPNGSIEVDPCPEHGGQLTLTWSTCDSP